MITDQDITKIREALKEDFASKEEFNDFKGEVKEFKSEFNGFRDYVLTNMVTKDELKEELKNFATRDELFAKLDGMLTVITANQEEHAASYIRANRHESWIKELAKHVDYKLS